MSGVGPRRFAMRALNVKPVRFGLDAAKRFSSDRCTMMGAGIAFYSAFSLAPTLLLVLAVAGWFFGEAAARGQLFSEIKNVVGSDAARAMQDIVTHAHHSAGGGFATLASIVLLIVGASATFTSLNTALDAVFDTESPPGIKGFALLLRARLMSFALVLGLGFLLVVSLVLDTAIQIAARAIFGASPIVIIAAILQSAVTLAILTVALAALIKWLPDTRIRYGHAAIGAFIAAVLFTVGRHLFALYLSHAGTATTFGAAGSLAVLMMWLYFSSVVFLLGAEVTAAVRADRTHASDRARAGATSNR
ncbi:membrane protein [Trinickia symbiotica]|uniref:YihY/virulence factor BrkB family protein n=2 Tax=Trinickia symbiotica TaxID=863227 RepID=A0A2N7X7Q8_9BURK|nr:YihY/virulence factor BrkB family protein [Trinickia symbiotica]PPK44044.1 membrane protein [Trinickia symbiotica]